MRLSHFSPMALAARSYSPPQPGRSEAIRRLVELGLKVKGK
jgi:hypothetical protein